VKRFARALGATLAIVVLGSFVFLVPQKNVTAQSGPMVTIVNPLPLPVTGNVNAAVNGTVAAQQSGAWNVGITGTPNVNIGNYPATLTGASVPVSGSVNANVTFPQNLPVYNLDDRGRIPYQSTVDMVGKCPNVSNPVECSFSFPVVPAGHRLVVEHVSGLIQTTPTPPFIAVTFFAPRSVGGLVANFLVPSVDFNGFEAIGAFDRQVLMFYDQAQEPSVLVFAGGATFPSALNQFITLSGYLLDCSVASCQPMAE
jgi:hypothetical protein